MAGILQIGISRNTKCDNTVGFVKSGHIYINQCFSVVIIASIAGKYIGIFVFFANRMEQNYSVHA